MCVSVCVRVCVCADITSLVAQLSRTADLVFELVSLCDLCVCVCVCVFGTF